MENYRVVLGAEDAPDQIRLDMQAESLASLIVKVMTICQQLKAVTDSDYDLEVLKKTW